MMLESTREARSASSARDRPAALPMYDLPGLQEANDLLWSTIGQRLTAAGMTHVPGRLTRSPRPEPLWSDPDLLLSQTCGYPLVTHLAGEVQIVATPGYAVQGCEGHRYRSAVIVRANAGAERLADLRGQRCAINDRASNSGMNLLRDAISPLADGTRFFSEVVVTGSHASSAGAVAGAQADVAAIDCVTLHHLKRLNPVLTGQLRILAWTRSTAGLPLITAARTTREEMAMLRTALWEVLEEPALKPALHKLRIETFHATSLADYREISGLGQSAALRGYPELV